jgi:acyl-CoA synthetase (AMP-forming)/AMP-acid ligase II
LHAGGANVLLEHFEVGRTLDAICEHRISILFTVPTILSRLVASPELESADLSSLRSLIYGGAPMPEAQLRAAVERIGHALMHIYGMTEAPWPITALPQCEHRLDNPRLRSVGKPTTVCEVRVVDDAGAALPSGRTGEIQIRGRNVMTGYLDDPEGTSQVLRDGWLSSGDLGYQDEQGYVFIVDRKKDVIISGGFNVYAAEVEAALSEHECVLEAAVVGLPHPDWGELVAAFVVPTPGSVLDASDLDAFARRRLSGYKRPRRIQILDELPRNATGKIQKTELLSRYGG